MQLLLVFCKDKAGSRWHIYLFRISDQPRVPYSARRSTYLQPILPPIPSHRRGEIFRVNRNIVKSAKPLLIAAECNVILSRFFDANAIVCVGLHRVEIEYEQQPCAFVDEHFVFIVLQRYVGLG